MERRRASGEGKWDREGRGKGETGKGVGGGSLKPIEAGRGKGRVQCSGSALPRKKEIVGTSNEERR